MFGTWLMGMGREIKLQLLAHRHYLGLYGLVEMKLFLTRFQKKTFMQVLY
jgi:hypothetical protein